MKISLPVLNSECSLLTLNCPAISQVHEVRPCRRGGGGGVQRCTWWGQQQIMGDTFICHTFSYFELSKLGEEGNFISPVE